MFFSADDEPRVSPMEASALLPGCVHNINNAHSN